MINNFIFISYLSPEIKNRKLHFQQFIKQLNTYLQLTMICGKNLNTVYKYANL